MDGSPPPAELVWRKHLALLVYLARSSRRARTREHLVGLLWGDKTERAARHSLREAMRILRRVAGDAAVETVGDMVRLAAHAVQLDVEELERHADAGAWERAAALVQGEFMEGFAVPDASGLEEWLAAERTHWRRRGVEVLVAHGTALLAQGRAAEAGDAAGRALVLAPLAEDAAALAVRAAALSAGRAQALTLYDGFVARLHAETGGAPGTQLRTLADRVRTERLSEPRRRPPTIGTESGRRAPLAGRERDLAQLAEAWDVCRSGRRATYLLVQGDPGLGKTRLLEEVAARAQLDGAVTALVRAVPADRDLAHSGLLALADAGLVDAPGVAGTRPESLAALAQHLTSWADRYRAGDVTPEPVVRRAFRDAVEAIADEAPVLLVIDDAHWMDTASLDALEMLLRDLADRPVAVAAGTSAAAAPAALDRLRAELGRGIAGASVRLEPLGVDALRRLATWALPDYAAEALDRVTRRVASDSAGFPLLAVELLHAISLGLELGAGAAGPWPDPARTLDQTLPGDLPDTVVAAIRTAFRRLSPQAQQVLQAAALLEARFAADRVAVAAALEPEATDAALDELEWQRWLTAEPRGYGFVARIVRDVVAKDLLTAGQRQRILDRLAT